MSGYRFQLKDGAGDLHVWQEKGQWCVQLENALEWQPVESSPHPPWVDKKPWSELSKKYGLPAAEWTKFRQDIQAQIAEDSKKRAEPKSSSVDPGIQSEAMTILETGDPMMKMLTTFNETHVGDTELAKSQFVAFGAQSALNSKGIVDAWEGPSGAGKSDAAKACVRQLPEEYAFTRTVTAKSLFMHQDELLPGMVIYTDDDPIEAGSDLEGTVKRAQTFFQTGAEHETLDAQRNLLVAKLPPRLMFLRTNVDSRGADIQLGNRTMGLAVNSSPEVDAQVCDNVLSLAEDGKTSDTVTRNTLVCRAMWRDIKSNAYRVKMPEIKTLVQVLAKRNRRNPSVFVDMVAGLACIRHRQRHKEPGESGEMVLYATYQDYVDAAQIFNHHASYLNCRLDHAERAVIRYLMSLKEGSATMGDIQAFLKLTFPTDVWSDTATRRLVSGRKDRGTGGLLEKCADIEPIDGYTNTGRPTRRYKWTGGQDAFELYDTGNGIKVHSPEEKGIDRALPTFSHLFPEVGKTQNDNSNTDGPSSLPDIPKDTEDGKTGVGERDGEEKIPPENILGPENGMMGKPEENNTVNASTDNDSEDTPEMGKRGKTWENDVKALGQIEAELQQAEERKAEIEEHDRTPATFTPEELSALQWAHKSFPKGSKVTAFMLATKVLSGKDLDLGTKRCALWLSGRATA